MEISCEYCIITIDETGSASHSSSCLVLRITALEAELIEYKGGNWVPLAMLERQEGIAVSHYIEMVEWKDRTEAVEAERDRLLKERNTLLPLTDFLDDLQLLPCPDDTPVASQRTGTLNAGQIRAAKVVRSLAAKGL